MHLQGVTPRRLLTALVKSKHGMLLKRVVNSKLRWVASARRYPFRKSFRIYMKKSFADFTPQLRKLRQLRMMCNTGCFARNATQMKNLPPTHNSLTMYLKRVIFQSMVWATCLQPKQNVLSVSGNGWYVKDGDTETVLMNIESAPKGLIDLTACSCKKSACGSRICTCRQNELACTEFCSCVADESCLNPEKRISSRR